LGFEGRGSVRVLDPDVALIVALDEDSFHHAELVALGLHFLFEIFEESGSGAFHLEHISHDQVRSGDCGNGRSLQI